MPWRPDQPGDIPTLGHEVAEWVESYLVIPDGPSRGQPFRLTDWQYDFTLDLYALDPATGKRANRRGAAILSKGIGKSPYAAALAVCEFVGPVLFDGWDADGKPVGKPWPTPWVQIAATAEDQPLELSTRVPTPDGWATVGDLRAGDLVLGGDGKPVKVVGETPVFMGERCYAVTFSDGERVVASAGHSWTVESGRGKRRSYRTVSTEDMARNLCYPDGVNRYRVPAVRFDLPDCDLPLDPYLLGLWLGDGATGDSTIACDLRHRDELAGIIAPLLRPNQSVVWAAANDSRFPGGNGGTLRIRNASRRPCEGPSMREQLREAGVLGNKHIPAAYLRAGTGQRMALLQGLMDSDGAIGKTGRATFTNKDRRIIDGAAQLLTTLGYVWHLRNDPSVDAWRLQWQPDTEPVARLRHKADRQVATRRCATSRHRRVVSVAPVPSVPVKCVAIDADDHLFLVGDRAVPTHNTDNTYSSLFQMLEDSERLHDDYPDIDQGRTRVFLRGNAGARIEPVTSEAGTREGQRVTFAVMDETGLWRPNNGGVSLAATIRRNVAKTGGSTLETSNSYVPGEGSVAENTARTRLAMIEGRTKQTSGIVYLHRQAPADTDMSDRDSLLAGLRAAYMDTPWIDYDRLVGEIWDPATDPQDARRFYLNQIVSSSDAWVTAQEWDLCVTDDQPKPGDQIALGFDGSRSDDATALVGCRVSDGLLFLVGCWERPDGPAGDTWTVDREEVDAYVRRAFDTYNVTAFFADPPLWQDYVDRWTADLAKHLKVKAAREHPIEFWTSRNTAMVPALERIHTAITGRDLKHAGDPTLTRHFLNAKRQMTRSGLVIRKDHKGSPRKIDAAMAATLAYEARSQCVAAGAKPRASRVPVRIR